MVLIPKNWTSFQHYKDRSPPWIKLHRGLLDNLEYHRLSPEAAKALPLIWLIASERDGHIPAGAELAFRLRVAEELANDIVIELMAGDFLVDGNPETAEQTATLAQRTAKSNGFGNRHISDATKRSVWLRDDGKCCSCHSEENIEYDHKVPVSKGGNSEESNIQLLCRPCNRAKRTKLATPAQPLRSLEGETEAQAKTEKIIRAASPSKDTDFQDLKKVYPRRSGNYGWKAAERKFLALVKTGVDPKAIIAAAVRLGETLKSKIGTEFIPMPASWLNSEDFVDCAVSAFEAKDDGMIEIVNDDQLAAWDQYAKSQGQKSFPRNSRGGWRFPAPWPPGYEHREEMKSFHPPGIALRSMQ